jgi:cell division protease FtsH
VAALMKNSDPLHKVTIIPRGMALGVTMQLPVDDKHTYSREYLETRLAIMMGGRAAEQVALATMTTGAGNDIEQATDLARKMVCEFGMSQLGPLTFGKKEEQIFLGREIAQHRDYSEDTAIKIDQEVRRLVDTAYKIAVDIVTSKREYLEKIAHALLEREVIDANDIRTILDGKDLPAKVAPPTPPDDGMQQVLKPEPGRTPSVQPGERPAQA